MKKLFYSLFMMALTAMTFTSCEDVPMPYDDPNKGGGGSTEPDIEIIGDGSAENPYNASSAVALFKSLASGAKSEMVYIKGKVSSIKEQYGTQYGNGTFYISDDGSSQNQFYVFRALYLGNKKYTSGDLLKEGDEVIICGVVTNYNGTIETEQNNAFLYSLNGVSEGGGNVGPAGEAKGKGTLEDPYNPAGATVAVANLTWTSNDDYQTTGEVYVKGKISRIADKGTFTDGGTYGNASFYISEDGTENGEFYCFRVLYLGNKKFAAGQTDIKVGDEVIVCGQLMNYRGNTPETVAGKAYLYSLNGKTEGGGGGGGDTPAGNVTKTVDGAVVTLVVAGATEGDKVTVDLNAQGWESGKAVDPATITLEDGTKITFAKGDGSNTPAYYEATKGVRVYAKNTITISGKAVAKVVLNCDTYNNTNYTGNSTLYGSASGTTFTICNEHSEAKGGDQLRVQTIEITYAK